MIDFTKTPETAEEARAFIRAYLTQKLPRTMFEQAYIEMAAKPQEQIDAELMDAARELTRIMKELRCGGDQPSDAVCAVFPFIFVDMVRERIATMRMGQAWSLSC